MTIDGAWEVDIVERMRGHTFASLLYGLGARWRVPYPLLRSIGDANFVLRHFSGYVRRKRYARRLLANNPWRGFMPKDLGYAYLSPISLPGLDEFVATGQKLYQDRKGGIRVPDGEPFVNILTSDDLRTHPILLEFAVSRPLVSIVSDYLGSVPRLRFVQIHFSGPTEVPFKSMLYHLDRPYYGQVVVYIILIDIGPEQGPLTFLPKDKSQQIRKALDYDRSYILGRGRVDDEVMHAHNDPDAFIQLTGKAGSVAIVDNSNCFHQGSRCSDGIRVMAQIRFALAHTTGSSGANYFDGHPYAADPVRMLMLDGANPGAPEGIEPLIK